MNEVPKTLSKVLLKRRSLEDAWADNNSVVLNELRSWVEDSTAKQVAARIGCSAQFLSDIIYGRRPVPRRFDVKERP